MNLLLGASKLVKDPATAASPDWSNMTAEGWIQAVGGLLLMVMVWLIKRLVDNHESMRKDVKEEGEKDRALIREEFNYIRQDHQQDMKALFADSKDNRKSVESGFKEVALALKEMSIEIKKQLGG